MYIRSIRREVVGDCLLGDKVGVAVIAHIARGVCKDPCIFARRQTAQIRNANLDEETSAVFEVGRALAKHTTCWS